VAWDVAAREPLLRRPGERRSL